MSRESSLIADIEKDALSRDAPVADALRKCVSLAGRAGSDDLLQWATRELRGYGSADQLPDYRKLAAPTLLDGVAGNYKITGQQISSSSLPSVARGHISENFELRLPIGQVEALARQAQEKGEAARFLLPGSAELAVLFNHEANQPFQHVQTFYWSVDGSTLTSVVDNVRTTLVQLVAALRHGLGGHEDALPSSELANQAVSVAVYGEHSQVNIRDVTVARSGAQVVTNTSTKRDLGRVAKVLGGLAALLTLMAAGLKLAEALGFPLVPF